VREIRSPGSVRGAARKGRPYRDRHMSGDRMGLRPKPPAFGRARSARVHLTSINRLSGTTFKLFGVLDTYLKKEVYVHETRESSRRGALRAGPSVEMA
jgi:hypothetical protein